MKKTLFAATLVAFAGSAAAAPLEAILTAHNQRSGDTVSSLIFDGSNSVNVPWYINNGVQPSSATWTWDNSTGVLQGSGLFWTTTHIGSSPSGGSIISDRVVDLAIDTVNKSTSASDYRCIEGTFLPIVGASGCATVQGVTATIFGGPGVLTTVDYNVGGDPTCVNRTVVAPEFSTGNPRGLTTREASGGCDATDGAFVMWNVVTQEAWGDETPDLRLILGNANTLEDSTNFLTFRVVVPVPAAVWLFASALGLMGFLRRRAAVA